MGSFFSSRAYLAGVAFLLSLCLYQRWQLTNAREDAEEWATKAHNTEASYEALKKEKAALLASLEARNASVKNIQQERQVTASKLAEATHNAQTRSWYDTPLPADISRLFTSAAEDCQR